MLRHPHRSELLSALAMAADAGEPLPEALLRLATSDSIIAAWAHRMVVPLREGADLWQVLIALGLVTTREAHGVSALSTADGLRALADGLLDPVPGERRIRYLPATCFLAAVWPAMLVVIIISVTTDNHFERTYRELQLSLPAITEFVINVTRHPLLAIAAPPVIALALAWLWSLLARIDGARWITLGFFPSIHRERAALSLLWSTLQRTDPAPSTVDWALGALGLSSHRHQRPAWVQHYQQWRRLSGNAPARIPSGDDPAQQCARVCAQAGLVDIDDRGPDCLAAVHRQRHAYALQVARFVPLVDGLMVAQAMASIGIFTVFPFFLPLVRFGCGCCSNAVGW